jgi:hypothetical protein
VQSRLEHCLRVLENQLDERPPNHQIDKKDECEVQKRTTWTGMEKMHVDYQYFILELQIRLFYQFDGWAAFHIDDFLGLVVSVLGDFALAHCDSFYFSGY